MKNTIILKFEKIEQNIIVQVRGPLETSKKKLKQTITELRGDIESMQNQWLKKQTNLVDLTNENETNQEEVSSLTIKQTSPFVI